MTGLVHEVLFNDRVCLTARHGHPLTKISKVTPADLVDVPWFVPFPYIQFREEMQSIFHRNNLDLPKNLVEASWNIATDYLEQSDAVSILPYNLISEGIDAGTLVELETDVALPTNPIGIIRRSNVDLTSTAKALVREIRYATSGRDKRYKGKLDRKPSEGPASLRTH
jgi:DNA-binding transcriptional LysR family regulator